MITIARCAVIQHDAWVAVNARGDGYYRGAAEFFQKLGFFILIKMAAESAYQHKQNIEFILRRHIKEGVVLIFIFCTQLIGIHSVNVSAGEYNKVNVCLLSTYHSALADLIVKVLFQMADEQTDLYSSAFYRFIVIHEPSLLCSFVYTDILYAAIVDKAAVFAACAEAVVSMESDIQFAVSDGNVAAALCVAYA